MIKTGKSERSFDITDFNETVILFLYSHDVSYHSPKASEGTRNTRENKTITDKIIFNCNRSDRGFWLYVRFFRNFSHKYKTIKEIYAFLISSKNLAIILIPPTVFGALLSTNSVLSE